MLFMKQQYLEKNLRKETLSTRALNESCIWQFNPYRTNVENRVSS